MPTSSITDGKVPVVETHGEVLPGLFIESVRDRHHPHELLLHVVVGRERTTQPTIDYRNVRYAPAASRGLVQAVRFPPQSRPFGTVTELTSGMVDVLLKYAAIPLEVAHILAAFVLASWFVDCLQVAPVLYLLGPESEAGMVLRLLGCLCRRPILLGDVDVSGLSTLPRNLAATLLINQRTLGKRIKTVLLASNKRHFSIARGRGQLHLYGAKIFACDPSAADECGLHVPLAPALEPLPLLSDAEEKEIAQKFQAQLLRYRMVSHDRVRGASVECRQFVPAIRDQVHSWLAPLCESPELSKTVSDWLMQQNRVFEEAPFVSPECIVAEASLFLCHREGTDAFLVSEAAEVANTLLAGRHEALTLTSKKVGLLLRNLGIRPVRVTAGYKIELTDDVGALIHHVARAYQVPPMVDGVTRCKYCPGGASSEKSD